MSLFGFSRGAYTARSLAGLIRNCGLLKKIRADRFPEAYQLYRRFDAPPDSVIASQFRNDYCRQPEITFIGVWDTVGALCIPIGVLDQFVRKKHRFHDVRLSSHVKFAYQALAIDERRKPFVPAIWQTKQVANQTVEQVWFAGVHSNIGGSYRDTGLSDLSFLWMIEKARDIGLAFDDVFVTEIAHSNHAGVLRDSMTLGYRILGQYVRPICTTAESESVHESALRRRNDHTYGHL